jgi:glycosyltransferase involved in cell wall biosynthesis
MTALRVLHHSTWKTECGIALYAEQLVRALDQHGITNGVRPIDVATVRCKSDAEVRLDREAFYNEAKQYDVVHIHHEYSFFANAPLTVRQSNRNFSRLMHMLIKAGIPTVVTFHSELAGVHSWHVGNRMRVGRFLGDKLRRKTSLYAQQWRLPRVLKTSKALFRGITLSPRPQLTYINGGLHPSLMRVIPLAAPRPCRTPREIDSQAAKGQLGFPRDCVLLSQFGFIFAHKGHENAVRALQQLPENYYFAVVGGRHRDSQGDRTLNTILEMWAGRNPERLRITGFVNEEDRDLYHAATDIFLAPYECDATAASGVVTWALTSGKPVITSNIPAFREINDTYDCMMMVAPNMSSELAWQIRRLVASPKLQQQLTQNAQRYADDHSWESIARRYASQFEELLANRPRRATATGAVPMPKAA